MKNPLNYGIICTFGVRITSGGTKAFFVEKLIKRKLRRITLGRYPELTVETARQQAQIFLGQIAQNIDPLAERRAAIMREVTLKEVMDDYINTRKSLKLKTIYDYKQIINIAFHSWQNKPLLSITKDQVAKHHERLGSEHGEAYANLAMRVLRALFNFTAGQYEDSAGHTLIKLPKIQLNVYLKLVLGIKLDVAKLLLKAMNLQHGIRELII